MVPERAERVGPPAATGEPACFHESRSACVILPAGPEPATAVKSIPPSLARFLTAGLANGLSPGTAGVETTGGGLAGGDSFFGSGVTSCLTSGVGSVSLSGSDPLSSVFPSPSTSNSIQT